MSVMDYADGVAPLKTGKSTQVAIRIEDELFAKLDALVTKLSPPGMALPRSEVIRAALAKGLEVLEGGQPTVQSGQWNPSRVRFELVEIDKLAEEAQATCRAANKSNKVASAVADGVHDIRARLAHLIAELPKK